MFPVEKRKPTTEPTFLTYFETLPFNLLLSYLWANLVFRDFGSCGSCALSQLDKGFGAGILRLARSKAQGGFAVTFWDQEPDAWRDFPVAKRWRAVCFEVSCSVSEPYGLR